MTPTMCTIKAGKKGGFCRQQCSGEVAFQCKATEDGGARSKAR